MLTDIDYNAIFGISEQIQEVADPAEEDVANEETMAVEEGANEQEPADPADIEDNDENNSGSEQTVEEPISEPAAAADDTDKKARNDFAAARRRAEMEAEIKRRVAEELSASIAELGLEDDDGNRIESTEELEAYRARRRKSDIDDKLSMVGLDREVLDSAIAENPIINEILASKRRAEEAERQLAMDKAKTALEAEVEEIRKLDPTVTNMEALATRPEWPKIYARMKEGRNKSLLEAFKLENEDYMLERSIKAAKQAAVNTATKNHMAATTQRGSGATPIPAEIMANYRFFMPNATDAEIQKHWAKEQKTKG